MKRKILIGAVIGIALVAAVAALVRPDIPPEELKSRYAPPPSRFITVQGMEIHYRDEGKGFPVVLIHGIASSLHTWEAWASVLDKRYRVVRMDLPGFGLTGPRADGDYRAESFALFMDEFLKELGIGKCHMAGHSMGGEIAWYYAVTRPGRVERLILIDAAGYPQENKITPLALARIPLANDILRRITPRFLIARSLKTVYGDPSKITEGLIDRHYYLMLRKGNRQAMIDRTKASMESDYSAFIKKISLPVLILWGERDGWIPLEHGYRFNRDIPGSLFKKYPGAGHAPMEEMPAETVRDAVDFLANKVQGAL